MRSRVLAAAAALLLGTAFAGCAQVSSSTKTYYEPVHVETVDPESGLKKVSFTEESARRAGLETAPVVEVGELLVVPSAALIYDKSGTALVYVAIDPLTYQRAVVQVVVDNGTTAELSAGPAVGTQVVTVGANQVWGAELGVGH